MHLPQHALRLAWEVPECVALHRRHGDHIPVCLQPILRDKLAGLVGTVEMTAVKREGTPIEYRQYVKGRDRAENDA